MAEKDIIQNMIARHGQSQAERTPAELDAHFVDIDERTTADFMKFVRGFAPYVNFYPSDGGMPTDWTPFFNNDDATIDTLIAETDGQAAPHLALLLAFLELYKRPQRIINEITARHLDFYYRDILQQVESGAIPDKAHLILELKKGASATLIGAGQSFTAGKDATGVELIYAPVRDTVINSSKVDSLRSIYLDRTGHGAIRYAPVANSADGVGGEFTTDEPRWNAFGTSLLQPGELGFALASTVLRMQEGHRTVTMKLTLGNVDPTKLSTAQLTHAFDVFITGEKNWLGPIATTASLAGSVLQLQFTLDVKDAAVTDYDPAIHGYAYASGSPVAQVHLRSDSTSVGYLDFQNVVVQYAEISVDVSNVSSLTVENDAGTIDPKKAFMPFGPQPTAGSRFLVGYSEALTKQLSRVAVTVQWKDIPTGGNFATHYANYGVAVNNTSFTAGATFSDGTGHEYSETKNLFNASDAHVAQELSFVPGRPSYPVITTPSILINALSAVGGRSSFIANQYVLQSPVYAASRTSLPPEREGFISFALNRDFLHATYRMQTVANIVKATNTQTDVVLLNEPYTPTVQSISLAYTAHSSKVNIASGTIESFAGGDVAFYHVTPTGPRREHSYLRSTLAFLSQKNVTLLPAYAHDGELEIGLTGLNPGDSVSLLFQVAEGSADPELASPVIDWYVLSSNYWKKLDPGELALDTTNNLLTSGIVSIVISNDATTDNTVLPSGSVWIKAGVAGATTAVSQMIDVEANAIEVSFVDNGNDPTHLSSALAAGSIAKLKTAVAAVKTVTQPYASFGGSPTETTEAFYTRVSERLRHKDRSITIWDYERMILQEFPRVHRVKCIQHAKDGAWMAPGNVLIVVIPDLRNKNALDPLQPRVDADTIDRITSFVQEHAGMGVAVKVKNPRYQRIRLDFKVKFYAGYEFNYYRAQLEEELIRVLSPWAFESEREINFGGAIYRSVLLDIVEDLPYVDYVTDFRMYSTSGAVADRIDRSEVRADTPDTVIVSDTGHTIAEVGG
jgi:uncharacterized phage protein gp47/JayE